MRLYYRGIAASLTAALSQRSQQGTTHQFMSKSKIRFDAEAVGYIKQLTSRGDAQELAVFAEKIGASGQRSLYSCIPCALGEKVNFLSVGRYVQSIGMADGHTIIFVNAARSKSSELELKDYCIDFVEQLATHCSPSHVTVVSHLFEIRQSIGKIRSLLVNGLVLHAQKYKLADPIIVSSDIDILATPENYGSLVREHFRDNALDVLTGPVHYGYSPDGRSYLGSNISLPELLLGNRVFHARRMLLLNHKLAGGRFFTTEGPNTAFRLSAYCAAGGYDIEAESGEDIQLGIGIFSLRGASPDVFAEPRNSKYDPNFWLASDPRRQLRAIVSQRSMRDTWQHSPFTAIDGVDISLTDLVNAYQLNHNFLQCDDILNSNLVKISTRVLKIRDQALENTDYTDLELEMFDAYFGYRDVLTNKRPESDEASFSRKLLSALKQSTVFNYVTNE